MKDCPNCGASIADEARFCFFCMASLDEKKPVGAPRRRLWLRTGALALAGAVAIGAIGWGVVAMTGGSAPDTGRASSGAASLTAAQASSRASSAGASRGLPALSSEATVTSEQAASSATATSEQAASSATVTSSANSRTSSDAASSHNGGLVWKPILPSSSAASSQSIGTPLSGSAGSCEWKLDAKGALTLSGKGSTGEYTLEEPAPWGMDVTSVSLSPGLTIIGRMSFNGCEKLTAVTLPASVVEIDDYAFTCCSSLAKVTFNETLRRIGDGVFIQTALTEVTLPDSVVSIGEEVFSGCQQLTRVTLSKHISVLPRLAFYDCKALTDVTLPDDLATIGERAFYGCTSLKRLVVPASVTRIDDEALPAGVTVVTTKGSYADTYAQKNGLKVEYLH